MGSKGESEFDHERGSVVLEVVREGLLYRADRTIILLLRCPLAAERHTFIYLVHQNIM